MSRFGLKVCERGTSVRTRVRDVCVGVLLLTWPAAALVSAGQDAVRALRDVSTREADRASALDALARLMEQGEDETHEAKAALQEALWDDRPPGARALAARALARHPGAAVALERSLGTALAASVSDPAGEPAALEILTALAACRTKQATRSIMDAVVLNPEASAASRARALEALAAQTGRRDFGADAKQWIEWWDTARWSPVETWPAMKHAEPPPDDANARTTGLYRRLFVLTREEQRDVLLIEMFDAPEREVRALGFELVMLSLTNAKPVAEAVVVRASRMLEDPWVVLRIEAARLLELVTSDEASVGLWRALAAENDETAAAAQLRAAARRPDERGMAPAMRWFRSEGPAREPAAQYLAASARDAVPSFDTLHDEVRAVLTRRTVHRWTPTERKLAVVVGLQDELLPLLIEGDRAMARGTAEALTEAPSALDWLIEAARIHVDLFDAAYAAIRRHRPTSEGYLLLRGLTAPTDEKKNSALIGLASTLPGEDLARLAAQEEDLNRRYELLRPLATPEFLSKTEDLPERVEVLLILARTCVALRKPAEALAALDLLPSGWQGPRARALRVTALLCAGSIAEAEAFAPGPDDEGGLTPAALKEAWLEGVRCAQGADHESRLAVICLVRFTGEWSEDHEALLRVAALRGR